MKFVELFETDEWNNNPITLEYLNKVQKARTFEYCKFLTELDDKYEFGWSVSLSAWITSPYKYLSWMTPIVMLKPNLSWEQALLLLSQTHKDKYNKLFNRMKNAKKRYERAGGEYE